MSAPPRPALGARLDRAFFERDVCVVARELVGAVLAHDTERGLLAGVIVETEAYRGPDDLAAHSAGGRRTARTEVMFGPAGHAYMFVVYGRNWAFNVVTGRRGEPHAVLVRALEPLVGLELMMERRGVARGGSSSGGTATCRWPRAAERAGRWPRDGRFVAGLEVLR
jgi:DNA-3-methyladenine glycosylase